MSRAGRCGARVFPVDLIPAQLLDLDRARDAPGSRAVSTVANDAEAAPSLNGDGDGAESRGRHTRHVRELVARPGTPSDLGSRRPRLWDPGPLAVLPELDYQMTLVASTESWETIMALRPDEAERAERLRAGACSSGTASRCGRASPPSSCWPPTSSSSARPAARRIPRERTPPATRSARSSPATTGSPTGAATR